MTYKALYRKWRPRIFEDVIGQDHVIKTLKNQIEANNVAHAYLFSGTRGTGKTSTAKIFARAVNCKDEQNVNPCNECEVCQGIITESIMDVIEIDAASNNGVDHIREIRENVKYPPSKGKYKVYIIDEVHMLSTGAFNALLKTLEEPPPHVIFILATTEPQKLPATILSRCQRFDFKPVKTDDMMKQLVYICKSMDINAEEEALRVVAMNAEGALRDALSILEQCISFHPGQLTYHDVTNTLGMVSHEFLFDMAEAFTKQNASKAIELVQQVIMEGKDVQVLIKDLIGYYRGLLLANMNVELEDLLSFSQEILSRIKEQSKAFETNELIRSIHVLTEAESKAKYSTHPRILLEVALITLCRSEIDDSLEGLLTRVDHLEKTIASGNMPVHNQARTETKIETKRQEKIQPNHHQAPPSLQSTAQAQGQRETMITSTVDESDSNVKFQEVSRKWDEILEYMRGDKKIPLQALLKDGTTLIEMRGNILVIALKEGFAIHHKRLNQDDKKDYITNIIEKYTGKKVNISFVMENEINPIQVVEEDHPLKKLQEVVPEGMLQIIDE
ncbi:DNA polymerase III, subunits gamma and tau [Alkaliphilus metalliredigens QYMF]|uniref:DNA-directed DNA polymerase n=1 Tax=Alkaliphilus metalliredigens (strain QYMF) TaxID=293826 RepID=A6TXC9_ALKMQ|nr:DNA polymerase III subunit gamma/tau [Alkaliphilus metalliredigens]ABR50847.1 DNA polymerase III, subunits gamma and tau [Alkaliphilus metalliredigens QYMF]